MFVAIHLGGSALSLLISLVAQQSGRKIGRRSQVAVLIDQTSD